MLIRRVRSSSDRMANVCLRATSGDQDRDRQDVRTPAGLPASAREPSPRPTLVRAVPRADDRPLLADRLLPSLPEGAFEDNKQQGSKGAESW